MNHITWKHEFSQLGSVQKYTHTETFAWWSTTGRGVAWCFAIGFGLEDAGEFYDSEQLRRSICAFAHIFSIFITMGLFFLLLGAIVLNWRCAPKFAVVYLSWKLPDRRFCTNWQELEEYRFFFNNIDFFLKLGPWTGLNFGIPSMGQFACSILQHCFRFCVHTIHDSIFFFTLVWIHWFSHVLSWIRVVVLDFEFAGLGWQSLAFSVFWWQFMDFRLPATIVGKSLNE